MKSEPLLTSQDIVELRAQAKQLKSSIIPSHQLDSRDAGWQSTSAIGSGMDYAESRLYQQGDEPRTINWRLSARSTETYVKTYHMEARPSLCIVLDQRRSMVFGTRARLKATQALRLATILIFAAEQQRLKINVKVIRSAGGWLEVRSAEEFLAKTNQQYFLREELEENSQQVTKPCQTEMGDALDSLSQSIEKGTLVYLISDFLDLNESHQKRLFQLQDSYFVQALHITDPAEQKVVKSGGVYLQDMQGDAYLNVKSQDSNITDLNASLRNHIDKIKAVILKSSVYYSPISTEEEMLHSHIIFPLGH